jgi:hypothetical protein
MLKPLLAGLALVFVTPSMCAAAGRPTHVVISTMTDPMTGKLRAGYTVAEQRDGSCSTASTTSARSNAWRCAIGKVAFDPCVAPAPNARFVYCPEPASRKRLIAVSLTKPLPLEHANRGSAIASGTPTSLALANGVTCGHENGTTGLVGGLRITYTCSDGQMLLGDVDRGSPRWRIHATPRDGSSNLILVDIETAEF